MFKWENIENESCKLLKKTLTDTPVLKCADPGLEYEVTSDASDTGTGAVLTRTDKIGCRPIAYKSKRLSPAEQDYSTPEKKLLGIVQRFTNLEILSPRCKIHDID